MDDQLIISQSLIEHVCAAKSHVADSAHDNVRLV